MPTSSVALAVNTITKEKNKVFLVSGAAASNLTGKDCTPNTIHWTYDTWALANGTGQAIVKTGRRHLVLPHRRLCLRPSRWSAIPTAVVVEERRQGAWARCAIPSRRRTSPPSCCRRKPRKPRSSASPTPAPTPPTPSSRRPSSASSSGGQNLAGLLVFITDVHALGLKTAQGLIFTEAWYWDGNDNNRAFAKEFGAANKGNMPTMVQAGVYSAVTALPEGRARAEDRMPTAPPWWPR